MLTFSLLETVNYEFLGTGALLTPELHPDRRLKQDFVLKLSSGQEYTLEAKFEDYPDSLFPEVAQLVVRPGKVRLIEPGWIYKTTAEYLLYVSTQSGIGTLIPRARTLQLQELMVQDVMLGSAHYDVPVMLNAALNAGAPGDAIAMPRAGIGLGLLRSNILSAYRCQYGEDGLYQFDLKDSLIKLKLHLTGEQPVPGGPKVTQALRDWAHKTLMAKPHRLSQGLTALESLPGLLAENSLVAGEQLPLPSITPQCYGFFIKTLGARLTSGQHWLFQHVAGAYQEKEGIIVDIKVPLDSRVKPQLAGVEQNRTLNQSRKPADLAKLKHLDDNLTAKRLAYLEKLEGLQMVPA